MVVVLTYWPIWWVALLHHANVNTINQYLALNNIYGRIFIYSAPLFINTTISILKQISPLLAGLLYVAKPITSRLLYLYRTATVRPGELEATNKKVRCFLLSHVKNLDIRVRLTPWGPRAINYPESQQLFG